MINRFTGKYRFLSNFAPAKVFYDEVEYRSVEHAYQAAKTLCLAERRRIQECPKPGGAKQMGKKVQMREDWDQIKFQVMEDLCRQKFDVSPFRELLLQTEGQELIEGNTWGDTVWGVCNGKGENRLGKILMKIREELRVKISR